MAINVPNDDREDGAGLLEDYIQVGRDAWADDMGWKDNVPAYYVIVAAFARAFQGG